MSKIVAHSTGSSFARAALLLLLACTGSQPPEQSPVTIDQALLRASQTYDVPRDLLLAIAWSQTRLDQAGVEGDEEHAGARGIGIMDLGESQTVDGPSAQRAAARLGVSLSDLEADPALNIAAAASELRLRADAVTAETGARFDDISDWAEVIGWYSGSADGGAWRSYARQVFQVMESGLSTRDGAGHTLVIPARDIDAPFLDMMSIASSGDSALIDNFVAAASCNYSNTSRGADAIDKIVVHTAQGSYSGTYNWFQNCGAGASAHYVIRSSDGEITQMVLEADTAWHSGHSSTNAAAVGIELEGYIDNPSLWYTDAQYRSLARLIADIAGRQGIPIDRSHIIGHKEVPGCSSGSGGGRSCHTDPGSGFDWNRLMEAVAVEAGAASSGGAESSGTATTTGTADLVGFVRLNSVNNTAGPIAGAAVALSTGPSTTTDSAGYYTLSDVPAGATTIQVTHASYTASSRDTTLTADVKNWGSVAMTAASSGSSGSSGAPAVPTGLDPAGWETVTQEDVTLRFTGNGASSYEIKLYWHDGDDWNYYYTYTTSSTTKTFWPSVGDTYYAWTVRGGGSDWTPLAYFYFKG
jgi:N-acetyl-anhydromuramyl-L-alanine amidase AmpD